ncbi:MAG: M28 family peptidase [Polyangiaceae bacterium]|nr:M28 family peptidase [Polyangiaceae bacterium]
MTHRSHLGAVAFLTAFGLALACSEDSKSSNAGLGQAGSDGGSATDGFSADTALPDTGTDAAADAAHEGGTPVDPAVMAQEMREVVAKLSVDLFPRDHSNPQHLDEAAAYITKKLEAHAGPVTEQTYTVAGTTYRNVMASLGPEGGERVVVGAHYDAVSVAPGADDNASGVAGLLQLAAVMANDVLSKRVDFVAFTLEEPPHFATGDMGSARHANMLANHGTDVVAMFALEMIGYYDDKPRSQTFPFPGLEAVYGNVGDFVAVIGRTDQSELVEQVKTAMDGAMMLRVESLAAPASLEGVDFSDHRSYWTHGWRALMITDTAFYRNTAYHKPNDTMDRLDFEKMADVVLGVRAAVLACVGSP